MLLLAEVAGWDVEQVRFFRTGAAAIAAQKAEPSLALFGIGGRKDVEPEMIVLDEHQPDGRVAGECGATLLAKHLGLSNMPELDEILAYALRADTQRGQRHFELAQALKTLHRYSGLGNERIWLEIARPCYRAVLAQAQGKVAATLPYPGSFIGSEIPAKGEIIRKIVMRERPEWETCAGLWAMIVLGARHWNVRKQPELVFTDDADEAWRLSREPGTIVLGSGDGPLGDTDASGELHTECLPVRIAKVIGKVARNGYAKLILDECARWYRAPAEVLPFELPSLIERLRTHGELDSHGILQVVVHFLSSQYHREEAFRACRTIEKSVERVGKINVTVALTDNAEAWGAFGGRETNVLVLRKESGNVNLKFTDDLHSDVMLAVARGLIVAESAARGEGNLVEARLAALAASPEATKGFGLLGDGDETWYLVHGAIHNATDTHPDVPPTRLTTEQIVATIREAITTTRA